MPSIAYDAYVPWANYHLTSGTRPPGELEPRVQVEDMGRIHAADSAELPGLTKFARSSEVLMRHIGHVLTQMGTKLALGQLGDPPRPYPAAMTGRGWSFSSIIGADQGHVRESMLMCDGLVGMARIAGTDLHAKAVGGASLVMVSGGTRLRELAEWAARRGLSVPTSGSHLGATIAGVYGTASHGSRLGYGGVQNMIVGVHLVTGIGDSVWLEREGEPILAQSAAETLGGAMAPARVLRDTAAFEDALIHIGCMGVVNCVAMRLVEDADYQVLRREQAIDAEWLRLAGEGQWAELARRLGDPREPVFYELTLDPHDWNGPSALHTLYFKAEGVVESEAASTGLQAAKTTGSDALSALAGGLAGCLMPENHAEMLETLPDVDDLACDDDGELPGHDWRGLPADMGLFDPRTQTQSAYAYYRETGHFIPGGLDAPAKWRAIHGDEITGGIPGSLYNASFAVERQDLAAAIAAISKVVRHLPRSFVFTVRFVSQPAGTLAFTRFAENAVIEIDGISPWICERTAAGLRPDDPNLATKRKMLRYLEFTLPEGARRLRGALDRAGIAFSNHWAKRGFLDRKKIQRDFGPLADPASRLSRWRATRDRLLSTRHGKALFWNWGAVNFGLLDRPEELPPELTQG